MYALQRNRNPCTLERLMTYFWLKFEEWESEIFVEYVTNHLPGCRDLFNRLMVPNLRLSNLNPVVVGSFCWCEVLLRSNDSHTGTLTDMAEDSVLILRKDCDTVLHNACFFESGKIYIL